MPGTGRRAGTSDLPGRTLGRLGEACERVNRGEESDKVHRVGSAYAACRIHGLVISERNRVS